jgi:hypothetical protein
MPENPPVAGMPFSWGTPIQESTKAHSLSGRATLIQSVFQAIPVYTMDTAVLPISLCDEIDK